MNDYLKYLRKSIDNQRGKKPADECEKVLGLNGVVNEFAEFYEKQESNLLVAVAALLNKWTSEKSFTKEELEVYKLALTELPVFMSKCVAERDRKNKEQLEKLRQMSTGE